MSSPIPSPALTRAAAVALLALAASLAAAWALAPAQAPAGGAGLSRPATVHFGRLDPPVVLQQDITVRFPTSNQKVEPMPLECSGLAWVGDRLLLTSDRHEHALYSLALDLTRPRLGNPEAHVVIRNEGDLLQDAEGLTVRPIGNGGWMAYALCSLSNHADEGSPAQRRHMLRVPLDAAGLPLAAQARVLNVGTIRDQLQQHFRDLGIAGYMAFNSTPRGKPDNTYRWGNVEGLTFSPDQRHLVCGMRNPLVEGHAILFVLGRLDEAFDTGDAARLELRDLFLLDLGGRGVSDLCWDPLTRGYLLAAARSSGPRRDRDLEYPLRNVETAVFWWSGQKGERPLMVASFPDMKIEALCRVGQTRFLALGSDEGDISEGRPGRQSVIVVMEFAGFGPPP